MHWPSAAFLSAVTQVVSFIKEADETGRKVIRGAVVLDHETGMREVLLISTLICGSRHHKRGACEVCHQRHRSLLRFDSSRLSILAYRCSDALLKLDDGESQDRVIPSIGTHIILPGTVMASNLLATIHLSPAYFAPQDLGMLNPSSDGRVLFALPWMGKTLVGTTGANICPFSCLSDLFEDSKSFVTPHPVPTEQDIEFIIQELRRCLNGDVLVCCT